MVKFLLFEHEDQSLVPKNSCKKYQGISVHAAAQPWELRVMDAEPESWEEQKLTLCPRNTAA